MSEIEVNNMKTYHASQKRAILNWQKKNKEKINEYNRQIKNGKWKMNIIDKDTN